MVLKALDGERIVGSVRAREAAASAHQQTHRVARISGQRYRHPADAQHQRLPGGESL
jgi:hypothetical protein